MPINVICPGCHARFTASEKFAGKRGPCPKCKTVITLPSASEEIKIHDRSDEGVPKDSQGRSVLKPIEREETQMSPLTLTLLVGGSLVFLVLLLIAGRMYGPLPSSLLAGGLLLVSLPVVVGGYSFLRDEELEPYRGRALWIRSGICGLVYTLIWIGFSFVPESAISSPWNWFFIAPPLLLAGAGIALATLDLEFGNAFFHYAFYLAVTMLLRWAIGLPPIWALSTSTV